MELDELVRRIQNQLQGQELDLVVKALTVCLGDVGASTGLNYDALMQYTCFVVSNQYETQKISVTVREDGEALH